MWQLIQVFSGRGAEIGGRIWRRGCVQYRSGATHHEDERSNGFHVHLPARRGHRRICSAARKGGEKEGKVVEEGLQREGVKQ